MASEVKRAAVALSVRTGTSRVLRLKSAAHAAGYDGNLEIQAEGYSRMPQVRAPNLRPRVPIEVLRPGCGSEMDFVHALTRFPSDPNDHPHSCDVPSQLPPSLWGISSTHLAPRLRPGSLVRSNPTATTAGLLRRAGRSVDRPSHRFGRRVRSLALSSRHRAAEPSRKIHRARFRRQPVRSS